jgi:hypothetical protein
MTLSPTYLKLKVNFDNTRFFFCKFNHNKIVILDGDEFFKTGVSVLSTKADPFDDDWSKLVPEKSEEEQQTVAAQLVEEVVEHKEEVEEPLSSPPQTPQQAETKIEKPHTPSEKKGNKKKGRKH